MFLVELEFGGWVTSSAAIIGAAAIPACS